MTAADGGGRERPAESVEWWLQERWRHYLGFLVLFGAVYGGLALAGRFPDWLLFAVLLVSLAKDCLDEYRLRRGQPPLAYAGIEHAPSNAVLLALLVLGLLDPVGSFAGLPARHWALLLAVGDLAFDLSQDWRTHTHGVRSAV